MSVSDVGRTMDYSNIRTGLFPYLAVLKPVGQAFLQQNKEKTQFYRVFKDEFSGV